MPVIRAATRLLRSLAACLEGDVVLVQVPGLIGAAAGEVVGVVAVQRVPRPRRGCRDAEAQWHGALHRELQPVAGLADAGRCFAAGDGDLDRPAVGVAGGSTVSVSLVVSVVKIARTFWVPGLADQDGAALR